MLGLFTVFVNITSEYIACILRFCMVGVIGISGRKDAGSASKKATNDCGGAQQPGGSCCSN